MSKLFKENGMISEEGERVFKEILDSKISVILKQAESESELRILGSLIMSRVGDAVANRVQAKQELTTKLSAMNDDQFYGYLQAKYGDKWVLVSLTPEEYARCPEPSPKEIRSALEEGRKAREAAERSTPMIRIDRNRRYR